jgi:hypothetical protein
MTRSDNSPAKVVSRLLHNTDYFESLSEYHLKEWQSAIYKHKLKCQHPKCKAADGKEAEEYYLKHSD